MEEHQSRTVLEQNDDYQDNSLVHMDLVEASIVEPSVVLTAHDKHTLLASSGEDVAAAPDVAVQEDEEAASNVTVASAPPTPHEPIGALLDQPSELGTTQGAKDDIATQPQQETTKTRVSSNDVATAPFEKHSRQEDQTPQSIIHSTTPQQQQPTRNQSSESNILPSRTVLEQHDDYRNNSLVNLPLVQASVLEATILDQNSRAANQSTPQNQESLREEEEEAQVPERDVAEQSILGQPFEASVAVAMGQRDRPSTLFFLHDTQSESRQTMINNLRGQGFANGLATELCVEAQRTPFRYVVMDNNPALNKEPTQQMLLYNPQAGAVEPTICTHWAELQNAVEEHAWMANLLGATTTYSVTRGRGRDISVGSKDGAVSVEKAVESLKRLKPTRGTVRWSKSLGSIHDEIYDRPGRASGVVMMAGMVLPPNKKTADELYDAVAALRKMSTTIVMCLATNDRDALNYYKGLRDNLNVIIVGDYLRHEGLIHRHNPWLNYTLPLHRSRETGFMPYLMDTLDRRQLTKDELRLFMVSMFGRRIMMHAPDLYTEWSDFYEFLLGVNSKEGRHWNVHSRTMEETINMAVLHSMYGEGVPLRPRSRPVAGQRDQLVEI